jgi:DNA polymerase-3 subunit gamma/tau
VVYENLIARAFTSAEIQFLSYVRYKPGGKTLKKAILVPMTEYQTLARKYRPQLFREVLGQDTIVTTLKNAIKMGRIGHAYLFSGGRGTGKTTLARILAKALNCNHRTPEQEPCNNCPSCREITSGNALDVLEIDGASNRGIEDIRKINETVGYAAATGNYKIYIIDEVHMLTKEAFNALLKTLEEPPPKVKFLFATTEPHKVLPTILSRCQRFQLGRIPIQTIIEKLQHIVNQNSITAQPEALRMIAQRADGGLRDAESLLDQIFAFHEGELTVETIASILGVVPSAFFFELDQAGKDRNFAKAFELADRIFNEGKDFLHFVEGLIEHFRNLLLLKVSVKEAAYINLTQSEMDQYEASAKLYTQEQCLAILEMLIEAQPKIRFSSSAKITLETLLLQVIRIHQRLPIEILVKKLAELEQRIGTTQAMPLQQQSPLPLNPIPLPPKPEPLPDPIPQPKPQITPKTTTTPNVSEDPTPNKNEIPPVSVEGNDKKKQSRYDTILQFAAVELEGTIKRKFEDRK